MVSVTFVVGVLFIGLMAENSRLEGKVAQYETKKSEVSAKIKDEEARTKEIDELKKYMQTDEYAKEVAGTNWVLWKEIRLSLKRKNKERFCLKVFHFCSVFLTKIDAKSI